MKVLYKPGTVLWLHSASEVDVRMVATHTQEALLDLKIPVLCLDPAELAAVATPTGLPAMERREIQRTALVQIAYLAAESGAVVIVLASSADDPDRDRVRGGVPTFTQVHLHRNQDREIDEAAPLPAGDAWVVNLDETSIAEATTTILEAVQGCTLGPRDTVLAKSADLLGA